MPFKHSPYSSLLPVTVMVFLAALLASCSGTRHLGPDQYLLRKNTVQIESDISLSSKGSFREDVGSVILQNPNSYLLGAPYKLNLYNLRYKTYQKDTNNIQLRTNFVEPPVIFDSLLMLRSLDNIRGFLINQGYFNPQVQAQVKYRKKKARTTYKIQTGNLYVINNVRVNCEDSTIYNILRSSLKKTRLEQYTNYNHIVVSEERIRIVNELRNWGYYNFGTNNITFELDTAWVVVDYKNPQYQRRQNKRKRGLDIDINIYNSRDSSAYKVHHIEDVTVYMQYIEGAPESTYSEKKINGITFKYIDHYINFNVIDQKILLRPGIIFTQDAYGQTLKLLNDLEIFQLVRISVEPSYEGSTGLNTRIILSANKKYDFGTNIEVTGGDLYTVGTAVNMSITDKNFLKGANRLTITGSYGVEANQDKAQTDLDYFRQFYLFSQNAGLNFNLTFPKFILPVNQNRFSRTLVPKTFLEGGINYLKRTDYFDLRSVNAGWGYRWRASTYEQWSVKPIFVNFLHLSNISKVFQERMDSIPAIRNSYQETFIEGENIEYVYNSELKNPRSYRIVRLGLEEGGLLMNGINALYTLNRSGDGLKFAEYVRMDFDIRQYIKNNRSGWSFRFYGGVGVPYNKATSLPYIKQYFVGGAYSVRGWRPRVLGPGSFNALNDNNTSLLFVDQAGDIKLELNAEYRFPIITVWSGAIQINGALFADAGNIWLMNPTPNMPGANFRFENLYSDLAASYGFGIRFDLGGFLVLRTDFAFQAKKPYVPEHNGWTIQDSRFTDRQWRKDNMNFNIAIGYPF